MDNRKKKVIGAAAGAAAAATAVGIAAVKMKKTKTTVLHVRQDEDEWTVQAEDSTNALSRHDTKREAVNAARDRAGKAAPSRLVIHRRDGSVQKEHSYQPEA